MANAQRLAVAVHSQGVEVVSKQVDGTLPEPAEAKRHFTESHTILLRVAPFGTAEEAADRLERANIIVTSAHLPEVLGRQGVRIGVQEITRLGATEKDMEPLAGLIADVIKGVRSPQDSLPLAREYAGRFQTVHFTWE